MRSAGVDASGELGRDTDGGGDDLAGEPIGTGGAEARFERSEGDGAVGADAVIADGRSGERVEPARDIGGEERGAFVAEGVGELDEFGGLAFEGS